MTRRSRLHRDIISAMVIKLEKTVTWKSVDKSDQWLCDTHTINPTIKLVTRGFANRGGSHLLQALMLQITRNGKWFGAE